MIDITVNGRPTKIDRPMPIDELLRTVEVPKNYLAVEVNEDVVPREEYPSVIVGDGDRVEVVTLVGGG
ncbi:sulfur carrier protein ThiS [Rhodopirellula sp. JC740]|uniref:Sulfur carrier protein ThiS n=1 Tax=Rhodopirellula halodulae TaxID=2894198 RepID=A0ABS8NMJ3_9BACT|nr:sulfur carrier protein ThiS [Rhodopirellula sp. JC740]MCC9644809.1 sulfur carrier protein ThiS [Rhodopirellula sp. JC740]